MSLEPVVIVHLGGEGGGYTILGREDDSGTWEFKVDGYDVTPELLGEEPWTRRGSWVQSLDEVLGQINSGWYRLYPRDVHPQFQVALLTEVTQRLLEERGSTGQLTGPVSRSWVRWQRLCGVRDVPDDD